MSHRVDVAIIGSGFAGSILAWILTRKGVRVALMDGAAHPRFAIGESSTPIADSILRRLGETWELPELTTLSTWGSWRQHHRHLSCGLKRGFSYFAHREGKPHTEAYLGERSLLVAASPNDDVADTHWYRPDVDAFLWRQAIASGAVDLSEHEVVEQETLDNGAFLVRCHGAHPSQVTCEWIIDASGQAAVLAKQTNRPNLVNRLKTETYSTFAHYQGVSGWECVTSEPRLHPSRDPFDPDDAAQHHLLKDGWVWMLRFNNGITSVGHTATSSQALLSLDRVASLYPTIGELMKDAILTAPIGGPVRSERLQRWFDPVIDSRRIMLPTAAVTLDPLHSTGIAHALAGVERLCQIILKETGAPQKELTERYRVSLMDEVRLLDRLLSTAYATLDDFDRFTIACMLYFAGAIRCEERILRGDTPTHLWNADDIEFVAFVDRACDRLLQNELAHEETIRQEITPWNSAGLMSAGIGNRYAYTATKRPLA